MTKTLRLLRLMQVLRAYRHAVTAEQLAERLSVSVRTVYRDIDALAELGAVIEGSAGVGYLLRSGLFLPPLMFSDEEIEALVLGARWVEGQGDVGLAQAADSALGKIAAASPIPLRAKIAEVGLWAPRLGKPDQPMPDLGTIRCAIRLQRKLRIHYIDIATAVSERIIWPIALGFFDGARVAAAWCELRGDFRHFRVDRIARLNLLDEEYPAPRRTLVKSWKRLHHRAQEAAKDVDAHC